MQRSKTCQIFFILILILPIISCTSVGTFTDPQGQVWKTTVSGNAETKLKAKDIEMSIKRKPILKLPDLNIKDLQLNDD